MRLAGGGAALGVRFWGRAAFLVALVLTVLANGSVAQAPLDLATIVFGLLAALSAFPPIVAGPVARLAAAAIGLLAALVCVVVVQTLPVPAGLANEAWKSVGELVGPVRETISVAPGMTMQALPRLALPFLVFLAALALFPGDEGALALWRALAYFGAGYAVFGLLQEIFLPDRLLFARKTFYVGYLTASFVNRNTAGTFFGIALLLNLGLLFQALRQIRIASLVGKSRAFEFGWRDKRARVLTHGSPCLIVAVALFLTQSRGAVGATFVGAVAGVALMAMRPITADEPTGRVPVRRALAAAFAGILAVVGLFALFAGRSVQRLEAQSGEDGRACAFASTIEAIKDHPIVGTGFGAFQDVFPPYRDAACAGIHGVWDRAHDFYLEGYLGLGLPFAIACGFGYAVLLGVCLRGLRRRRRLRFVPVMGLGALILASLHALVDFSLQISGVAVYFAAALAATATISLGGGAPSRGQSL